MTPDAVWMCSASHEGGCQMTADACRRRSLLWKGSTRPAPSMKASKLRPFQMLLRATKQALNTALGKRAVIFRRHGILRVGGVLVPLASLLLRSLSCDDLDGTVFSEMAQLAWMVVFARIMEGCW